MTGLFTQACGLWRVSCRRYPSGGLPHHRLMPLAVTAAYMDAEVWG